MITAAGVSSGIDMALVLAERIAGPEVAQAIQLAIEYDPAAAVSTPARPRRRRARSSSWCARDGRRWRPRGLRLAPPAGQQRADLARLLHPQQPTRRRRRRPARARSRRPPPPPARAATGRAPRRGRTRPRRPRRPSSAGGRASAAPAAKARPPRCRPAARAAASPGRPSSPACRPPCRSRSRRCRTACRAPARPRRSPTRLTPASAVVAQGCWRLKKVRENSRLTPWNGSEIDHHTSASVTRSVASGAELAALVDQPRDRLGQHRHQHRAGDQQQADLPHAVGHRPAQVVGGPARGEAGQRGEQDRGDRDREQPLRQLVDPERLVDGRRRLGLDAACRTAS